MKKIYTLLSVIFLTASFNVFAAGEKWVSVGYPVFVHMGTDGTFILNGSEHGTCNSVKPSSFRVNMKEPHAKEMFSWILYMAAQKKELTCVVNSGCGTKKVTINFCRGRVD